MKKILKPLLRYSTIVIFAVLATPNATAQLYIGEHADWYMQKGSIAFIQGDVEANSDILGEGTFILSDSNAQEIDFHGFGISHLAIENKKDVSLSGNLQINGSLLLAAGKINCGNNQLTLGENATARADEGLFINTNGTGKVRKKLIGNLPGYFIPIGSGTTYAPVSFTADGSFSNAYIDVSVENMANPHTPASAENFLNTYWKISKNGIRGNLKTTAWYPGTAVHGTDLQLSGFTWDGMELRQEASSLNSLHRMLTAELQSDNTELFAMNPELSNAGLTLSPNPVHNSTIVRLYSDKSQTGYLKVMDTRGRILFTKSIALSKGFNQQTISLGGQASGNYTVQVATGKDLKTIRVIKL